MSKAQEIVEIIDNLRATSHFAEFSPLCYHLFDYVNTGLERVQYALFEANGDEWLRSLEWALQGKDFSEVRSVLIEDIPAIYAALDKLSHYSDEDFQEAAKLKGYDE